ncbi:MAG: site-specific DNA-methyltransferase [Alphaproteobacteria bacterium]|nr:site-specific DNA-methyltransferase [Alphaproteobacteria bacterium]
MTKRPPLTEPASDLSVQGNLLAAVESPPVHRAWRPDAEIVLLNDDVLKALATLPGDMASLIISSPPYNIGKAYETQVNLDQYLDWQAAVIADLVCVLSLSGSLCWQTGNYIDEGEVFPLDVSFYPIFKKAGLRLRNRVIWHFDHGLHASKRFSGRYETLLWFTKTDDYVFHLDPVRVPAKYPGKTHYKGEKRGQPSGNPLGKNPSDFWTFLQSQWDEAVWEIPNVKSNHPEKTEHPCQFPVELVERCVLAMTNPGDWVLDPFAGVGSSAIAAVKNGRKSVGIERDAGYCAIAGERLRRFASGELKLRPLGKPVHQPTGREKVAQLPLDWAETGKG